MGQAKTEEKYDAVIVGSGANGISAAIYLQQKGLKTLILEKNSDPGGATRSGQLTLPGYVHDIGSAVLPMSYSSPFFQTLPLEKYGLEWIFPEIAFAQTLENGEAIGCYRDISKTAANLGKDKEAYEDLMNPLVSNWAKIDEDIIKILSNGDIAGEMSFLTDIPANAHVTARQDTHCISIEKKKLRPMMIRSPSFHVSITNLFNKSLIKKITL